MHLPPSRHPLLHQSLLYRGPLVLDRGASGVRVDACVQSTQCCLVSLAGGKKWWTTTRRLGLQKGLLQQDRQREEITVSTTPRPDAPRPRRLLTISEVADLLGVDLRHVRRLVYEKRIPFKWGHLLRFDPVEIEAWIDAHLCRASRAG